MICAQHSQTNQANETLFTPKCRHSHTQTLYIINYMMSIHFVQSLDVDVGHTKYQLHCRFTMLYNYISIECKTNMCNYVVFNHYQFSVCLLLSVVLFTTSFMLKNVSFFFILILSNEMSLI